VRENEKMMFILKKDVETSRRRRRRTGRRRILSCLFRFQEGAKRPSLTKGVEVFSKQKKPLLLRFSRAVLAAFFVFYAAAGAKRL